MAQVVNGPLAIETPLEEIVENFSYLDDWEDRYGYLIELGKSLQPIPEEAMSDDNKVQGCVSQVWLVTERDGDRIHFKGASDAHIVSGLIAVTLSIFSGKTPQEILATNAQDVFEEIGLEEHITPQRSNGLRSMVTRIRQIAAQEAG